MTAGPVDPAGSGWECEAYGDGASAFGARCFMAPVGERFCDAPDTCHEVVAIARLEIWQRMQARAAEGDPVFVELAREFTSPDQIMSSREAPESD